MSRYTWFNTRFDVSLYRKSQISPMSPAVLKALLKPSCNMNFLVPNEVEPSHMISHKHCIHMASLQCELCTTRWEVLMKSSHICCTRPFTCVNSLVCNKVRASTKEFPTFSALERPCLSMNSLVFNEGVFVAKGLSTVTANIRVFSSMDATLMLNKCGFVSEDFPTVIALVRPCSIVNSLVHN